MHLTNMPTMMIVRTHNREHTIEFPFYTQLNPFYVLKYLQTSLPWICKIPSLECQSCLTVVRSWWEPSCRLVDESPKSGWSWSVNMIIISLNLWWLLLLANCCIMCESRVYGVFDHDIAFVLLFVSRHVWHVMHVYILSCIIYVDEMLFHHA